MNKKSELGVLVCEHIVANKRPIKMIVHNHDETWEFMCGEIDHFDFNDSKVIGITHLLKKDESLYLLKNIPVGCLAQRDKADSHWKYSYIED
ncbi:MAG: hypothetical protein AB8B80_16245 [Marinicellaceae bacterium]